MLKKNLVLAMVCLWVFQWGCEEDLKQAFDDMRAATPEICSDYCVEKTSCEWPATAGNEGQEAYSAATRQCVFECAWYAENGAYVSDHDLVEEYKKNYPRHIPGDLVIQSLECLYELVAYQCTLTAPYLYVLSPGTINKCNEAGSCLGRLKANAKLVWRTEESIGICEKEGTQTVEAPYY
ncbi:MAG: hypothetical protein GY847_10880 [Proteobacteria bacterium]|nr:hypothetical protein [Pseudomonadota bacterium]